MIGVDGRLCVCGYEVCIWEVVEDRFFYWGDCLKKWYVYWVNGLVSEYVK